MSYQFLFRLLRSNKALRNLWIGETVSYFGDNFFDIAIMWLVFVKTGSGLQTGLVLVSSFLPQVIVGPFLGVLADAWNHKRLMQWASLVQGIVVSALALAAYFHVVFIWEIYVASIVLSIAQLAYSPARAGMFPDLVETDELMGANALFETSRQIARLIGSSFGGVLIAVAGSALAMTFDAATFLVAVAFLQIVCFPTIYHTRVKPLRLSMFQDLKEGIKWLSKTKVFIAILVISTFSNIALGPVNVLAPMLMKRALHQNASALGIFDAAIGLGIVLGGLLLSSVRTKRVGILFAAGIGMQGLAMAVVAVAPNVFVAYTGNFILGLALAAANLPTNTLRQMLVPRELRGRIGSVSGMVSTMAIPITYGGVGILGDFLGARWTYGFGATLALLCMLAGVSISSVRKLSLTQAPAPPADTAGISM